MIILKNGFGGGFRFINGHGFGYGDGGGYGYGNGFGYNDYPHDLILKLWLY